MNRIKLVDTTDRLAEIKTMVVNGDDEDAIAAEHDFYRDVLFTIANANVYEDKRDLQDMARQALLTQNMDFGRHCS